MNLEYWRRLKQAFAQIHDADPSEREALFCEIQRGEPELAQELQELLAADEAVQRKEWWPVGRETGRADDFQGNSRFELNGRLGVGGFGVVYRAYDRQEQRLVALKVLRVRDPDLLRAFKREFRVIADVRHPNLVAVHELFIEPHHAYFTMELIDGEPITQSLYAARIGSKTPSAFTTCLQDAFQQLSRGLMALHRAGIIHRDLKPSNVLRTARGRVAILDFGMVTVYGRNAQSHLGGTPAYAAPELLRGIDGGAPSDWYAVGLILHECLLGHLPEDGSPPTFAAPVSASLETLCKELLRTEPSERPPTSRVLALLIDPADTLYRIPTSARAPGSWSARSRRALFGRQHHLARLHACYESSRTGRLSIAQVTGNSGMGKTALVQACLEQLADTHPDLVVLQGRCHERETLGYRVFDGIVDELADFLVALAVEELRELVPPCASELITLFPALRVPLARAGFLDQGNRDVGQAAELRSRAFGAFRELLGRLAKRRGLVIFADDLQWGDEDSGELLRYLLSQDRDLPMFLVLSYRSNEIDSGPLARIYQELTDRVEVSHIPVEPLLAEDARAFVESQLGLSHPLVQFVNAAGEGAPFLLNLLVEEVKSNPDATLAELTDSNGLDTLVVRSISKLPRDARKFMALLSVAAEPLRRQDVYCALAMPRATASDIEDLLRVRSMLRTVRSESLEPFHDRLRTAFYAALSPQERAQLHGALADTLSDRGNAETLAYHYHGAGFSEAARHYSLIAARSCAKALAFDRAATHFRKTLAFGLETVSEEAQIYGELADALANSGKGRQAAECYLLAAEREASRCLQLRLLAGQQLMHAGDYVAGLQLLTNVLQAAGVSVPQNRPLLGATLLYFRWRLRSLTRNVHVSTTEVDTRQRAILEALWALASSLALVDTLGAAYFESHFLVCAIRYGDTVSLARALCLEAIYASIEGEQAEWRVTELLNAVARACAVSEECETLALLFQAKAIVAWMKGDFLECLALANRAEDLLAQHSRGRFFEFATARAFALASQIWLGQFSEHAERFEPLIQDAKQRNDSHAETSLVLLAHAHLYWLAKDDWRSAERQVANALERWPSDRGLSLQHIWAIFSRVEIGLYCNDVECARSLLESNWPRIKRAGHLRIAPIRIWFRQLRVRVMLASATLAQNPRIRRQWLHTVERETKLLERESLPLGRTLGAWSRGLLDLSYRREVAANQRFEEALKGFDELGMQLHSLAVRGLKTATGQARPHDVGSSVHHAMTALGIACPGKMLTLLAPVGEHTNIRL